MKLKKLIIILSILATIALCILLVLLNYQKKNKNNENMLAAESIETPVVIKEQIQEVNVRNDFYVVQNCISKFYTYYSDIFKDPLEGYIIKPETIDNTKIQKDRIDKVYKLLDDKYLEYKGITLDNLSNKLSKIGDITININKMYVIEKESGISIYFVYGNKKDTLEQKITDFSAMVKIDMKNRTYKILLDDYVKNNYENIEIGQHIEITEDEIKNEIYNTFTYQYITDEEYINDLFLNFKNNLRVSKEQTYDLLDDEYKKQCFSNIEEYLSYINENYYKILTAKLDTYSKENNKEYTQYTFKDTKENYYIFKEIAPFKYTVMLDNYSIPGEDFQEEYNMLSKDKKVILNIKRFFMGIDNKNYGYSYSVLSENFRNNKFASKEDFINYAKQNFFDENEIKYISFKEENGIFIYEIILTDATGKNSEERTFNMIMKLNSETNFEMSFSKK